jgi:hypothetical protein
MKEYIHEFNRKTVDEAVLACYIAPKSAAPEAGA